mmetsp:Transcript_91591/g.222501  ORF Transcript_91591/g.222501 Transcript_91591/m.222501 type:complete len:251 (-) Transcript_91591:1959-2711(-)
MLSPLLCHEDCQDPDRRTACGVGATASEVAQHLPFKPQEDHVHQKLGLARLDSNQHKVCPELPAPSPEEGKVPKVARQVLRARADGEGQGHGAEGRQRDFALLDKDLGEALASGEEGRQVAAAACVEVVDGQLGVDQVKPDARLRLQMIHRGGVLPFPFVEPFGHLVIVQPLALFEAQEVEGQAPGGCSQTLGRRFGAQRAQHSVHVSPVTWRYQVHPDLVLLGRSPHPGLEALERVLVHPLPKAMPNVA